MELWKMNEKSDLLKQVIENKNFTLSNGAVDVTDYATIIATLFEEKFDIDFKQLDQRQMIDFIASVEDVIKDYEMDYARSLPGGW